MISQYYRLVKPGIVRGNLIVALAGFLFASRGEINILSMIYMLLGLGCVIASSCVVNNYLDREIDRKMKRTEKRALVTGEISDRNALALAAMLGLVGVLILFFLVNSLAARIAIAGFLFYVVVYGYWKRRSVFGTLVGSISGAVPPVVGYVAVTNALDIASLLLFLVLVFWQMPHFYSIGIYSFSDYKKASIPILPVEKGMDLTKKHIKIYMWGFVISTFMFTLFGYTGIIYLIVTLCTGGAWLYKAYVSEGHGSDELWAKKMFSFSLVVLLVFCLMISLDFILP